MGSLTAYAPRHVMLNLAHLSSSDWWAATFSPWGRRTAQELSTMRSIIAVVETDCVRGSYATWQMSLR